jgi:hypothetical protein
MGMRMYKAGNLFVLESNEEGYCVL